MPEIYKSSFKKKARRYLRDAKNSLLYRDLAPKTNQLLFVDPKTIKSPPERMVGQKNLFGRKHSAMIVAGDWDKNLLPIEEHPKIMACMQRFQTNTDWEQAGAYQIMLRLIEERGSFDKCYSLDDIKQRYQKIDTLFDNIKADNRLRPRSEFVHGNHREYNGILVHIGCNGAPIFSGSGCHRLSIAKFLAFSSIPCELGVVHADALKNENYKRLIKSTLLYRE